MQGSKWFLAAGLALLAACGGPPDRDNNNGGPDGGPPGGDGGNTNTDGCSDAAKSVYVVDQNNTLSRFDPPTRQFMDLGRLSCPAGGGATPFSMGVDRNATAWVLYSNGQLFRVDTNAANLPCTATPWTSQSGLTQFGMGFSTDAAGGTTDTLFIVGGDAPTSTSVATLAKLDTTSFTPTVVSNSVQGSPELTGTGNAELWGFFPDASAPRIVRLDKSNGAAQTTYTLGAELRGQPTAWAFAFHGGKFYVFLMKDLESATTVYEIDASTGAQLAYTRTNGRTIVGAGVSTCAPVIL